MIELQLQELLFSVPSTTPRACVRSCEGVSCPPATMQGDTQPSSLVMGTCGHPGVGWGGEGRGGGVPVGWGGGGVGVGWVRLGGGGGGGGEGMR